MASKVSVPDVVKDADKVIGVWKVNPTFTMMGVTAADFSTATFGPDSAEYAQAGGVRKSERKHPQRKPKA